MYTVEYSDKAIKELQKSDPATAVLIYGWIGKNIVGCSDPFFHGKSLVGNKRGYWRYRVGAYRLIAEVDEERRIIFIVRIAHRREVYE
jgi:mRNA interferase RelE/StbE